MMEPIPHISTQIWMKNEMSMINLKKSDVIRFGRYQQKNDPAAAAEPIEWIVLETDGKSAKLLSRYGLTTKAYDEHGFWPVTWENCTLRAWLNNEFLNTAFTEEEQQRLLLVTIEADYGPFYTERNETRDKIFLPTAEEAEKYLPTNDERICIPTERAIREGAYAGKKPSSGCWWWLRTPSISMPNYVCVVDTDGSFDDDGFPVGTFGKNDNGDIVVRPVIVLDLEL